MQCSEIESLACCFDRYTHNEKRYHSEVRQEAVQQALAAMHGKTKALPLPSKRSSVLRTTALDDDDDEEEGNIDSGKEKLAGENIKM